MFIESDKFSICGLFNAGFVPTLNLKGNISQSFVMMEYWAQLRVGSPIKADKASKIEETKLPYNYLPLIVPGSSRQGAFRAPEGQVFRSLAAFEGVKGQRVLRDPGKSGWWANLTPGRWPSLRGREGDLNSMISAAQTCSFAIDSAFF